MRVDTTNLLTHLPSRAACLIYAAAGLTLLAAMAVVGLLLPPVKVQPGEAGGACGDEVWWRVERDADGRVAFRVVRRGRAT